jgi:hypothetical protein
VGFSEPHARPDHRRARRKVVRTLLPMVTAPNLDRKARASLRRTMSRRAPPMRQVRPAPARDPRLPDRPLPSLPRPASARATQTRQTHPAAFEIPRTPPLGERTKAPAEAAARALPEPPRHPRPTAGAYPPWPRPLPALANCRFLLSSVVPIFKVSVVLPLRSLEGTLYNPSGKGSGQRPLLHVRATIAAGRSESVARGIRDENPGREAAKPQVARAARGQP